jgi:hypothetical protein
MIFPFFSGECHRRAALWPIVTQVPNTPVLNFLYPAKLLVSQ